MANEKRTCHMTKKRLIDANALLEEIQFRRPVIDTETKIVADSVAIARRAIVNAPTVDAVPVVHGRWEPWAIQPNGFIGSYCCTACKKVSITASDYCPNCGAKMDGVNEDG